VAKPSCLPLDHPLQAVGAAQEALGADRVAGRQQLADGPAAHHLPVHAHGGQHVEPEAEPRGQRLQEGGRALPPAPESEVVAHAEPGDPQPAHQPLLHEANRREGGQRRAELQHGRRLHAQAGQQAELQPEGRDDGRRLRWPDHLQRVAVERDDRRGPAALGGEGPHPRQERLVAPVDAVQRPHAHHRHGDLPAEVLQAARPDHPHP